MLLLRSSGVEPFAVPAGEVLVGAASEFEFPKLGLAILGGFGGGVAETVRVYRG